MEKKRVILVTDGDEYARKAVEYVAKKVGGRCISKSQGNPTRLTGEQIVKFIFQTPHDPVFVMFDDSGFLGEGPGEQALMHVANHKHISVLGVIAVASKTHQNEWTRVDVSVDRFGELTEHGVDKSGIQELEIGRINGDTVYCLDELDVPIIVGVGDIGKMARMDHPKYGCPITEKATQIILERSGFYGTRDGAKDKDLSKD
ncbi:stage V sporulation protein AE [Bacillus sp. CGMCC 1.16541]|uniref:stage V sporulation protein AE n=1 Tax=Bacillus sp. CGMCC 1.16541 TaxID=2185143 RepID=UPI000D735092|nr:stage V sporulation protein AE [Bacillus sp. CGMCC 1.16541]